MYEQLKKCESGFTFEFCCTLPPANSLTELTPFFIYMHDVFIEYFMS